MTVEYINRSDKTYYLHVGKTKTGKDKFYFSMKKDGELATHVPEGYEIYENPKAQVFLRRIRPKIIADDEITVVEDELMKHTRPKCYMVDTKKNIITIYEADSATEKWRHPMPFASEEDVEKYIEQTSTYFPVLRFILEDREQRLFIAQRYCFLGRIDDWIFIGGEDSLEKLAEHFIQHLGKDSFFWLFPSVCR